MRTLLLSCLACCLFFTAGAQKSESVLKSGKPVTWLGLDFSQARYIGSATQFKEAGEITTEQLRDKYFPGWNDLFVNEQAKYDVAKYTDRGSVTYALEVTKKANNSIRGKIFSEDPNDYERLTAADIAKQVKSYNFAGNKGVGLVFIIEGMSKGKEEVSAWVTFVDMGTKSVLQTQRITGRAGGFGFRNYWAKGFFNILKDVKKRMD